MMIKFIIIFFIFIKLLSISDSAEDEKSDHQLQKHDRRLVKRNTVANSYNCTFNPKKVVYNTVVYYSCQTVANAVEYRYVYQESGINQTITTFNSAKGSMNFNHSFTNDIQIDLYVAIYDSNGKILVYEMVGQFQFYAYSFSGGNFPCQMTPSRGFDQNLTTFTFTLQNSNNYNGLIQTYTFHCNIKKNAHL
jgi:hypothetical protein